MASAQFDEVAVTPSVVAWPEFSPDSLTGLNGQKVHTDRQREREKRGSRDRKTEREKEKGEQRQKVQRKRKVEGNMAMRTAE